MKKVHIVDKNGYKACEYKNIPKAYKNNREFDFGWSDVDKITCLRCKKYIREPYWTDEYFFAIRSD